MARSRHRRTLIAAIACVLVALGAVAQDPIEGWLRGTVADTDGEPIRDASVELRPVAEPSVAEATARTNKKGAWSIAGLAPGRYEIHIKAVGFINVNGWVTVPTAGRTEPVEVQMLPLSFGTPIASRGNAGTMRLWIEKGNSLLEQGHPAQARAVYARALAQLPRIRQPEVLRSVARTHFLEGRSDLAIDTLRQALEIARADPANRQLFSLLMEEQGRTDEATAFLAELDARPPEPVEEPTLAVLPLAFEMPQEIADILAAPPEPPRPHRTGSYKTAFTERSAWSHLDDYVRRMGTTAAEILAEDPEAGSYSIEGERFEVSVPDDYRPEQDWGLLVWISPTEYGGTRGRQMAEMLARHRLIWIGANRSGNERRVWDRVWLALDAAHNMRELYDIDPERIYVGGYSGGGRTASRMGVLYPELVRGSWSLYGCDYFRPLPLLERPGAHWPAAYDRPPKEVLGVVTRRNRFVLVTGTRDFNFTQTRATAREMKQDGFEHVTYFEMPDADHFTFPDGEWMDRIFTALDRDRS